MTDPNPNEEIDELRSTAKSLEEARDRLLVEQSRRDEGDLEPVLEALHEGVQELTEEVARRREQALQSVSEEQTEELIDATRKLQDQILERHRSEVECWSATELNRVFLEIAPVALLEASHDGSICLANAEAMRLLELSFDRDSGEFGGDWERRLVREDGAPCPEEEAPLRRCLRTAEAGPPEILGIRRSDGLVSWAVFRAAPLFEKKEGGLRGAAASALDITERRRLEELSRRG